MSDRVSSLSIKNLGTSILFGFLPLFYQYLLHKDDVVRWFPSKSKKGWSLGRLSMKDLKFAT
jgi:hypothetical protein